MDTPDNLECADPYGLGCREGAIFTYFTEARLVDPQHLNWGEEVSPPIVVTVGLCGECACCLDDVTGEEFAEGKVPDVGSLDTRLEEFSRENLMFNLGVASTRRIFRHRILLDVLGWL